MSFKEGFATTIGVILAIGIAISIWALFSHINWTSVWTWLKTFGINHPIISICIFVFISVLILNLYFMNDPR